MSLVSLRDLVLDFGGFRLLDGAALQIGEAERLCLIGRNGAGKSTLLHLVAGLMSPGSGVVEYRQGLRLGLLPQEIAETIEGRAFDIAAGGLGAGVDPHEDLESKRQVDAVLSRLQVNPDAPFALMSGGMKRRVLLARALASDPDLLLLDEPTNHLDIDSIAWLEGFLQRRRGGLLFVSHDRTFIEAVATRIVELDRGDLSSWPGGYSDYLRHKLDALEVENKARVKFDKKLKEEEVWLRRGIKARRTRNEGRVRALEQMRETKRADLVAVGSARLATTLARASAKRVIEAKGLSFSYPDMPIVTGLDTVILRGDKVGVIGPNGIGKTTLLKLLLGEIAPTSGTVHHGSRVEVAHLDQLRSAIDEEKSLIENLVDQGDTVEVAGERRHIIGYLKDFLFDGEAARTPAKILSGGERNRLLLAKLFTRPANVLVLDEPTNDLDTDTLELLESLLVTFDGTVLIVSHDRTFLNNVVTSTLVFEGEGRVVEYAGGYDDLLAQRQAVQVEVPKEPKVKKEKPKSRDPSRLTFKEKQTLEALPAAIEAMEAELEALRARMASPDFYQQTGESIKAAIERMEALEPLLEETYARWEALAGRET